MTKYNKDDDRPVYMISVAAKLTGMHPQTLRIYERKKLLRPRRTPKSTRLYSQNDIERLRFIQELTQAQGVNLAGVKIIMDLQNSLEDTKQTITTMEQQAGETQEQIEIEVKRATQKYRHELVLVPKQRQLVRIIKRGGRKT